MLPLLALCAALAASPPHEGGPVALLVVRRTSVDAQAARALAETVATLLESAGVAVEPPAETVRRLSALGVKETTKCGGRKACVLELLRQLERPAGVALSVSQLGGERSVALEAFRARDGAVLAKEAAVLKPGEALDAAAVASVARALAKEWPAENKSDAPVEPPKPVETAKPVEPPKPLEPPPLTPRPVEPPVVVAPIQPQPQPQPSHAAGVALVAAAVVAAGVAAGFGASALSARGQVGQSTGGMSPYTGSEAQALADAANRRGTVGAAAGGLAAVLAIIAVATW